MKFKTTKKQLQNSYTKIFKCGYCDLQNLFTGYSPIAYTCGVYGWNFDAYDVEGVLITTGYRGMMGERIPRDLINKYEDLANEINQRPFTDNNKKSDREELRHQFINELLKKGGN